MATSRKITAYWENSAGSYTQSTIGTVDSNNQATITAPSSFLGTPPKGKQFSHWNMLQYSFSLGETKTFWVESWRTDLYTKSVTYTDAPAPEPDPEPTAKKRLAVSLEGDASSRTFEVKVNVDFGKSGTDFHFSSTNNGPITSDVYPGQSSNNQATITVSGLPSGWSWQWKTSNTANGVWFVGADDPILNYSSADGFPSHLYIKLIKLKAYTLKFENTKDLTQSPENFTLPQQKGPQKDNIFTSLPGASTSDPYWVFLGWKNNEDNTFYNVKSTITVTNEETTLTAVWAYEPFYNYHIEFNIDGEITTKDYNQKDSKTLTIDLPKPKEKPGYIFSRWSSSDQVTFPSGNKATLIAGPAGDNNFTIIAIYEKQKTYEYSCTAEQGDPKVQNFGPTVATSHTFSLPTWKPGYPTSTYSYEINGWYNKSHPSIFYTEDINLNKDQTSVTIQPKITFSFSVNLYDENSLLTKLRGEKTIISPKQSEIVFSTDKLRDLNNNIVPIPKECYSETRYFKEWRDTLGSYSSKLTVGEITSTKGPINFIPFWYNIIMESSVGEKINIGEKLKSFSFKEAPTQEGRVFMGWKIKDKLGGSLYHSNETIDIDLNTLKIYGKISEDKKSVILKFIPVWGFSITWKWRDKEGNNYQEVTTKSILQDGTAIVTPSDCPRENPPVYPPSGCKKEVRFEYWINSSGTLAIGGRSSTSEIKIKKNTIFWPCAAYHYQTSWSIDGKNFQNYDEWSVNTRVEIKAPAPPETRNEYHIFKDWFLGKDHYQSGQIISLNMSDSYKIYNFIGDFQNYYGIKYQVRGDLPSNIQLSDPTKPTSPSKQISRTFQIVSSNEMPTAIGYTFQGWYDSENNLIKLGSEYSLSTIRYPQYGCETLKGHWTKGYYYNIYIKNTINNDLILLENNKYSSSNTIDITSPGLDQQVIPDKNDQPKFHNGWILDLKNMSLQIGTNQKLLYNFSENIPLKFNNNNSSYSITFITSIKEKNNITYNIYMNGKNEVNGYNSTPTKKLIYYMKPKQPSREEIISDIPSSYIFDNLKSSKSDDFFKYDNQRQKYITLIPTLTSNIEKNYYLFEKLDDWSINNTEPAQGQLKASKWTELQNFINKRRRIGNLTNYSFTPVSIGTALSAALFNEIVEATTGQKNAVNPGDPVSAQGLNQLVDKANNIKK